MEVAANGITRIIGIFIAVLLLLVFPIYNQAQNVDDITRTKILAEANELLDNARDLGYITPNMYEDFLRNVSSTGNVYEITLEHLNKVVYPDLTDPLAFVIVEEGYYNKEILEDVLFNESLPLNQRKYYMNEGDMLTIKIINTSLTTAEVMRGGMVGVTSANSSIYVKVGGMIRHDYR